MRKSTFVILVLCLAVAPLAMAVDVTIDHANTADGDLPGINVSQGQTINFVIRNTESNCFNYNAKDVQETPVSVRTLNIADTTVFTFSPVTHDEETVKYEIDVTRKTDAEMGGHKKDCEAATLVPRKWTIPVRTFWRFAMSGAITGDSLTKPGYFLEAGKDTDPADSTKKIDGFFVRKNGAGQDRLRFGTAAMAHLYHPYGSRFGVTWAPISFGLGLQDNEVQYFVGTTARFGNRAFITGGVTLGPRDRLPNGVTVGKFVTDSAALGSLPKKTSQGVFVSIGFSFFEANVGKLTGLIAKP